MNGVERAHDPEAAIALMDHMSAISERYWCAGWLDGLEFHLWRMLQGGPRKFGLGDVSREELDELAGLSEQADGWWYWSDDGGDEVFVSRSEWRTLVASADGRTGPAR